MMFTGPARRLSINALANWNLALDWLERDPAIVNKLGLMHQPIHPHQLLLGFDIALLRMWVMFDMDGHP